MWKNTYRSPDQYLQENVKMKKWINQCVQCQAEGYKPEMPADDEGGEFKNIRYRFKCLAVDDEGLCDVCGGRGLVGKELAKVLLAAAAHPEVIQEEIDRDFINSLRRPA